MNPEAKGSSAERKRYLVKVNGIVQGVGFRPFVFNAAAKLGLSGFVANTVEGVLIEIEGNPRTAEHFLTLLQESPPPLAEISALNHAEIPLQGGTDFTIRKSENGEQNRTFISPDVTVCEDCLSELFDPADRRYGYPFINCTNCGPRYTIISTIPYDRPFTSMADFKMCPQCQAEYDDPANRRFHAQPNACPVCGPHLAYKDTNGKPLLNDDQVCVEKAVKDLLDGKIVAVKGLGGFHLAVDAANAQAVKMLRERKNRYEKPLAVMAPDLDTVRQLVSLSSAEEELLAGLQRPIVLLNKKAGIPVAEEVAPGNKRLGVMLPYTPLHYLLLKQFRELNKGSAVLVMTSANLSEEPIAIDNNEAFRRLAKIADSFLTHNRDILIRADDSVLFTVGDKTQFLRRSRGYVPRPVFVKTTGADILALGGQLKNTICILKSDQAFLSQHIGDLENLAAYEGFKQALEHFRNILETHPQSIACDLHPDYSATRWAEENFPGKLIKVQHHHAHMAAVMAEWHLQEPLIGLILDGTGYGYDGTVWGGEVLVGDYTSVKRAAWLQPVPMPGGEAAIHHPWRMAVSYLKHIFGQRLPDLPFLQKNNPAPVLMMLDKGINAPLTSSCGRLFDAVAAMSGGRQSVAYEAQAAIELMQAVMENEPITVYDYQLNLPEIPLQALIRDIVTDILNEQSFEWIATRFHQTLIELFANVLNEIRSKEKLNKVVLSGGVFQNEVLLAGLNKALRQMDFEVYLPRLVPANDGGIALGQAVIARQLVMKGMSQADYLSAKDV